MDSTFEWEDELAEMMKQYSAELPSLTRQVDLDRAEAQKRTADGVNLDPLFANLEAWMYRCTRIEKRIAELESERSATKENK